ncbi:pmpB [Symbiodinium sp. CCMP2592]|nr:pmpB [Symbiodinium sp. CCMP2592]
MKRLLLLSSPFPHWPRRSGFAFWARCEPSGSWGIAEPQASTSVDYYEDCPPGRIRCQDLLRMVEEARSPPDRRRGKTGLPRAASQYLYRSTLRGWSTTLASTASTRDRKKGRQSDIDSNHLLDLVLEQGGLCAYSGVPMQLLKPHSHWRASIERIDNGQGYVKGNCCLIAAEFNSAVHKMCSKGGFSGSAQWSKQKVQEVARVRTEHVQLQQLSEDIAVARLRPSPCRTTGRRLFRGPDAEGRWQCRRCCIWKWQSQYSNRKASSTGLRNTCKQCASDMESAWLQTLRGHGMRLLTTGRQRAGMGTWTGSFALVLDDLLEMLWLQGGRCYYSGVPLHCAAGPADWVWSIERLDNSVTYTKENCVLIAREFQTSDQSRNKARHPVFGTAQWSRRKVSHIWGPCSWEVDLWNPCVPCGNSQ